MPAPLPPPLPSPTHLCQPNNKRSMLSDKLPVNETAGEQAVVSQTMTRFYLGWVGSPSFGGVGGLVAL